MEGPKEVEVDENEFVPSSSNRNQSLQFSAKCYKRKGFIGNRRLGTTVLAELETISENNAFHDTSFQSRANLSFNHFYKPKEKSDRLCKSFNLSSSALSIDENGLLTDVFHRQNSPSKPQEQTTPPSVLRQRIKDANEVRFYLEKELDELKEFTTTEKQILAIEKGYDTLQEENCHLKQELNSLMEENSNFKKELEEMSRLTSSQKMTISDLEESFVEVKKELKTLQHEKETVTKELAVIKKKFLDEEFKNEIAECKWKERENELKKSLEEAWVQLNSKEEKLTKMKEKINILYSERDLVTMPSNNEPLHSVKAIEKIKAFGSKVEELFNLSSNHFENEEKQVVSLNLYKCHCKGDSVENMGFLSTEMLNNELKKCQEEVENLNLKLKQQECTIQEFNSYLYELENSLESHTKNMSDDESSNTNIMYCKVDHKTVFEKFSCELLQLKEKLVNVSTTNACDSSLNEAVDCIKNEEQISQNASVPDNIECTVSSTSFLNNYNGELASTITGSPCKNEKLTDCVVTLTSDSEFHDVDKMENTETIEAYKERIKLLELEISNYKIQLAREQIEIEILNKSAEIIHENEHEIEEMLSKINCSEEVQIPENCVEEEATLCRNCFRSAQKTGTQYIGSSPTFVEMPSQTDFTMESLNNYTDKIISLECELNKKNTILSDQNKSDESPIERIEVSCQTETDMVSVAKNQGEELNQLENVVDCARSCGENGKGASSQTDLNFVTIEEYVDKIKSLETITANSCHTQEKNFIDKSIQHLSSTELVEACCQTLAEEFENAIKNTQNYNEQKEISCQTYIDLDKLNNLENELNDLKTVMISSDKSLQCCTEQVDVSSQTVAKEPDTTDRSIQNSAEQVDQDSQTYADFVSNENNEKALNDITEKLGADLLSTTCCEMSNQTEFTVESISTYENKIYNLEKELALYKNKIEIPVKNSNQSHLGSVETSPKTEYLLGNENVSFKNVVFQEHSNYSEDSLNSTTGMPDASYIEEKTGSAENSLSNDIGSILLNEGSQNCQTDMSIELNSDNLSDEYSSNFNHTIINELKVSLSDSFEGKDLKNAVNESVLQQSTINVPQTEYIELPALDNSTLDLTFKNHLEHSILKSKLHTADLTVMESYDPLASISEESDSPRNLVSLPFHSPSHAELTILKERCKTLNEELASSISLSNKYFSLITEVEMLLMRSDSGNQSDGISTLEEIIRVINETTESLNNKDVKELGLLTFFKSLHHENVELNSKNAFLHQSLKNVCESLMQMNTLKNDFLSLKSNFQSLHDIDNLLKNVSKHLIDLNEDIRIDSIANKEIKDNLNNLINENRNLKVELANLCTLNTDLKNTSQLYSDLIVKHAELQNMLEERENNIKESAELKANLKTFIENIKNLNIVKRHIELNSSEINNEQRDNSYYLKSLIMIEKLLMNCHDAFISLEDLNELNNQDFFKSITKICKDKIHLEETCSALKSELLLAQKKLSSITDVCNHLKNSLQFFSSDVVAMKNSVKQEIEFVSQEIVQIIQNKEEFYEKIMNENNNLKLKVNDFESLKSINDNYCDLQKSYRELEADFHQSKADCAEHLKFNESLKCRISQIENENTKLKEKLECFESEICSFTNQTKDLKIQLSNLEPLIPINEKYSELIKIYESLETELKQNKEDFSNFIQAHEALKLTASQTESENLKLKELINKYEKEVSEYNEKNKDIENIKMENEDLRNKLHNLESACDKYSELLKASEELEMELLSKKEACSEFEQVLESLKLSMSDIKTENEQLKETTSKYEQQIGMYIEKLMKLETLEHENEDLKSQLDNLKSLISINDKYSELMSLYQNLEQELSQSNKSNNDLSKLTEELRIKNSQLELENNNYKEEILKYESNVLEYKKSYEALEVKFLENEKEMNECNKKFGEKLNELNDLTASHSALKEDNELYAKMLNDLRNVINSVDNSTVDIDDTVWVTTKNDFKEIFVSLKMLFSELIDVRKKLQASTQTLKSSEEEISGLLKKEQEQSAVLKEEIKKYENEINNILSTLNYSGRPSVNEESWLFIKEKLSSIEKNPGINQSNEDITDLEKRVAFLESQLLDTDNFKRKFSKELHGLKPELNVSDLMKLSLEDLQITMLSTIMEKENAVVENLEKDYETKLALSCDRIHQLEEEEKRRLNWINEIENENDRLLNKCKVIQEDNNNLRSEILLKVEKIENLEKQIEEKRIVEELILQNHESEKHEQENLEKEKALFFEYNVQEAVSDLTKQLEGKCKECEDALVMLQNKSETIFQLEKVICDSRVDKAHLEEEVKSLKETLNSQVNNFEEVTKAMKNEISSYKIEIAELSEALASKDKNHFQEKLDLQKEIESKVFLIEQLKKLGNEAEVVIKHNIGNLLDSHMEKVDKLNIKIKGLSNQLNGQNIKFNEFKNQSSIIENLQSEISSLKATLASLEKEKFENLTSKNETNSNSTEKSSDEIILLEANKVLTNELEELKKELVLIQEERNAFFQDSLECHELKNKMSLLNENLQQCQCELASFKNKNENLEKQVVEYQQLDNEFQSLKQKFKECKDELISVKDENNTLLQQSLNYQKLQEQFSDLNNSLKQCQDELVRLKEENEKLLELKEDKNSIEESFKIKMDRLENEKEALKKEFLDNLEFEKDLRNSIKLELTKKENELLNLKKEKDLLMQEINKIKLTGQIEINKLKDTLQDADNANKELQSELLSLKKFLEEKSLHIQELESKLEDMNSKFHSEDSCPYKIESEENKNKITEYDKLLAHERETFKLWKINVEEDLRCKVLLIGDLESKLKKETQSYKDAIMSVAELQQKLHELEDKLKKSEMKVAMQREVFIREKSKLEAEIKNKEMYELKVTDLKKKSEEISKNINSFLEKVSGILKKDIIDLGSALHELCYLHSALEEEKERVKQLDEECEELNKNIQYLEKELGKLYVSEDVENEKLNKEISKLKEEQERNERLAKQLFEAQSQINSLQSELQKSQEIILHQQSERKSLEINIQNLLEGKQNLQRIYAELEQKFSHLQITSEQLQKKENNRIDELMKEINYLKLQIVNKNTKISALERRLESDSLPFQRRAEAAEKKVEEVLKELKSTKIALNSREPSITSSPKLNVRVDSGSSKIQEEQSQLIASLQEEVKELQKKKRSLKQLAILRNKEIKDLTEKLERRNHDLVQVT